MNSRDIFYPHAKNVPFDNGRSDSYSNTHFSALCEYTVPDSLADYFVKKGLATLVESSPAKKKPVKVE